jgi:hypothetical protein
MWLTEQLLPSVRIAVPPSKYGAEEGSGSEEPKDCSDDAVRVFVKYRVRWIRRQTHGRVEGRLSDGEGRNAEVETVTNAAETQREYNLFHGDASRQRCNFGIETIDTWSTYSDIVPSKALGLLAGNVGRHGHFVSVIVSDETGRGMSRRVHRNGVIRSRKSVPREEMHTFIYNVKTT